MVAFGTIVGTSRDFTGSHCMYTVGMVFYDVMKWTALLHLVGWLKFSAVEFAEAVLNH